VSAPSKICYPVAAIEFITSASVALLMRNIEKSKSLNFRDILKSGYS
jgi:hypothetical protein